MITRDPLRVPCLSDRYWATFPDRSARDLARTLRFVEQASVQQLPVTSHLSPDEQLQAADQNVSECLRYAREHLNL